MLRMSSSTVDVINDDDDDSKIQKSKIAWRFAQRGQREESPSPPDRKFRVMFSGSQFQAGLENTRQLLVERNLQDSIELVHAPTDGDVMRLAPTVDVALPFMQRFDAAFLRAATKLVLVQQYGVGLEGIDIQTATKLGIAVSNVPANGTGNAQATSEHALLLSMSLLRQTATELPKRLQNQILGGLPAPKTLFRRRVTVVGYGAVGSVLCTYLTTMGATVTAVRKRPWVHDEASQHPNINRSNHLEDVLPETELLILACPVTPDTFHLMNHDRIQLLPEGAYLVNVGRGPLAEYHAVRKAIESSHLAGFASDVGVGHPDKPSEPWDPDDPLTLHPNTIFTPHVGGYSEYSYGVMADKVLTSIESIMKGEPPPVWCNGPSS